MQDGSSQREDERIATNLRRSVIQRQEPQGDAMVQVMREICRTKEQAWQQNRF